MRRRLSNRQVMKLMTGALGGAFGRALASRVYTNKVFGIVNAAATNVTGNLGIGHSGRVPSSTGHVECDAMMLVGAPPCSTNFQGQLTPQKYLDPTNTTAVVHARYHIQTHEGIHG